jgi:hypothetical protein
LGEESNGGVDKYFFSRSNASSDSSLHAKLFPFLIRSKNGRHFSADFPARPRHAAILSFLLSGLLVYTQAKHSVHGRQTLDLLRVLRMESMRKRLDTCREGPTIVICAPRTESRLSETASKIHPQLLTLVQASPHTFLRDGVLHGPPHSVIAICPHRGLPLFLEAVSPFV